MSFDYEKNMCGDNGFFPLDNEGIWHSGIHVGTALKDKVFCPVNGRIEKVHISEEQNGRSCFVISIPFFQKKNRKAYDKIFVLVNNIESVWRYSEYLRHNEYGCGRPVLRDDLMALKKMCGGALPFGLRLTCSLDCYSAKYIACGDRKLFTGSWIYVLPDGKTAVDFQKDKIVFNPLAEGINFSSDFNDAVCCQKISDGVLECPAQTYGVYRNGFFIPRKNSSIEYERYKKLRGFVCIDGKKNYIDEYGNVHWKTSNAFFFEQQKRNVLNMEFYLFRHDRNKVIDVVKNNTGLSIINPGLPVLMAECFGRGQDFLLAAGSDREVLFGNNSEGFVYEAKGCAPVMFIEKIECLSVKQKIQDADGIFRLVSLIGLSYEVLKPQEMFYVKLNSLPSSINRLKVLVNGRDFNPQTNKKLPQTGVFHCRPHVYCDGKNISFKISKAEHKSIAVKSQIVSAQEKSFSICPGVIHYNEPGGIPVGILNGKICFTDLNRVERIVGASGAEFNLFLNLDSGAISLDENNIEFTMELLKNEELENVMVTKKTFLGFSKSTYFDMAVFMNQNPFKMKVKGVRLNIPSGTPCRRRVYNCKKMFISNNTVIHANVRSHQAILIDVDLTLTIYKSNNKGLVTVDENKKTITVGDTIRELYFRYHAFYFEKNTQGELYVSSCPRFSEFADGVLNFNSAEVTLYLQKVVLPFVLNHTHTFHHIPDAKGAVDSDSCQFNIVLPASVFAQALGFKSAVYIDMSSLRNIKADGSRNIGKGELVSFTDGVFTYEDAVLPLTRKIAAYEDKGQIFEEEHDGLIYEIQNEQLKNFETDVFGNYVHSLVPLNFDGADAVSDKNVCPQDKLFCCVADLKEQVKSYAAKNGVFKKELCSDLDYRNDGSSTLCLWKKNRYVSALKHGMKNVVALHPLEFDRKLHDSLAAKNPNGLVLVKYADSGFYDLGGEAEKMAGG